MLNEEAGLLSETCSQKVLGLNLNFHCLPVGMPNPYLSINDMLWTEVAVILNSHFELNTYKSLNHCDTSNMNE